jgi:hypothetical protein
MSPKSNVKNPGQGMAKPFPARGKDKPLKGTS